MEYRYVDVHSHVALREFETDRNQVLSEMKKEGIAAITVGVNRSTSLEAVALAEAHDHIYATIGLHPHDVKEESFDSGEWVQTIQHPKIVAVGECGIDFYRGEGDDPHVRARQLEQFELQIEFAAKYNKPLMLHGRPSKKSMDAYEVMLEAITKARGRHSDLIRGNVHFFVGNERVAKSFFEAGFAVSFTGVVTFTNDYDAVVKVTPLDRILVETDSPYAAPIPFRGKRNDPRYLPIIVERLAEIRGEEEVVLQESLLINTKRLFGIPGMGAA